MAMTDFTSNPIFYWHFQKVTAPNFAIDDDFIFTLLDSDDAPVDLFHYTVLYGDVTLQESISGIDSNKQCGPQSNIDQVYFVWENFLRFSYKKYAIALSIRGSASRPKLMFLKHYRVESDGWRDKGHCAPCIDNHQEMLLPFHACDLSDD